MQTLTHLADAARAVIAADRDGELTDELINALELALKRSETPRGRGPYGVDAGYFDRKLARIAPALDNYTPGDLAREFARMAAVADRDAACAELLLATEQSGEAVAWQFYDQGRWHNGNDQVKDHRKNTEAAGIPTRDLYARPQPAPAMPDIDAVMRAVDEYAASTARVRLESLYGTSQSYVEECYRHQDEARAKLYALLTAAPQPEQVEQQAPGKWQPISTAPQNGMHILCYMETEFGGHMEPMYWSDGCWTYCLDGDSCQYTPSHWMPSPPAPTQEAGARMTAEAKGDEA